MVPDQSLALCLVQAVPDFDLNANVDPAKHASRVHAPDFFLTY